MKLGTVGVIGALAFGAAIGAVVPVPTYESHQHAEVRTELAAPQHANYAGQPDEPDSYRLPMPRDQRTALEEGVAPLAPAGS